MKKEEWRKRIDIIVVIFTILIVILGYKLFQKQIIEYSNYQVIAENQYIVKKDIPASRGKIYASDMFPLATNRRVYQVAVTPKNIKDKMGTAEKLAPFIGKTSDEIFKLINNEKYYIPPLKKNLTEVEGDKIAELKLKGIMITPVSTRFYPEKELASQVLGFVDAENAGHYGIEGYYNKELKGIGGEISGATDILGRYLDVNSKSSVQNGSDVVLTIDHNVQYQAEEILKSAFEKFKADAASIIITEPKTGKIIAMANYPTYDPNSYNLVPIENQSVFNNIAVTGAWEPGSVFKPLVMAAAIDKGLVQPETEKVFGASVEVDGYTINTATHEAFGRETMTQVLENSDNVAMVWISDLLKKDSMNKYIQSFGFGKKSGIELDNESAGNLADVKKWSDSQLATMSFGQGITVTPLQMVMAISAIANSGKLMKPYIVNNIIDQSGRRTTHDPKVISQVVSQETANKVNKMLVSVVDNGHGKKAAVKGYKVGGKTGTAQIPKPGGGYYTDRQVGTFAGFFPTDDPKFAMVVRLDNPKDVQWAESSAAPTFGEMATWLLNYYQIPPTENVQN